MDLEKSLRRCAVVVAGLLVVSGWVSLSDGAAETAPPAVPAATIDPASASPGDTITVSGSECPQSGWDKSLAWTVHVQISAPDSLTALPPPRGVTAPTGEMPHSPVAFTAEGYTGRSDATGSPRADGTWLVPLEVPGPGEPFPAEPGQYPISALCFAAEGAEAGTVGYARPSLIVTAASVPPVAVVPSFTG